MVRNRKNGDNVQCNRETRKRRDNETVKQRDSKVKMDKTDLQKTKGQITSNREAQSKYTEIQSVDKDRDSCRQKSSIARQYRNTEEWSNSETE